MACMVKNIVLILSVCSIFGRGIAENLTVNVPTSVTLDKTKNPTSVVADALDKTKSPTSIVADASQNVITPCSCGVFLSGQFVKGSPKPPVGYPAIVTELEDQVPCGPTGVKQCATRCMEGLVKYLPNSPSIICGSIDRDTFRERAYLFVNNCNNGWKNTNFSAGKEYCCKDGAFYKCPVSV